MAALRLAAGVLVAFALLGAPAAVLGADPTPSAPAATEHVPTCDERFPEPGPGGVDLRLGCIIGAVGGFYATTTEDIPTPFSTYAIGLGGVIAGVMIVAWIAGRFLAQRAGERLAPVLPGTWWVCTKCKSVNGAQTSRCYSCGSPAPEGPSLTTDDKFESTQSFGNLKKRG